MAKAKRSHKQMDHTSAAQAQFLDSLRERAKRKAKFMSDRFGRTARGGAR